MPERVASQKNELEVTIFLVDFAISRILSRPLQWLELLSRKFEPYPSTANLQETPGLMRNSQP
jgi:hypothetical protein